MRDRYNRWVIPFFLLAWLAPRGEVGRVEQKMKGGVEWRQAGRVDGKCTASH